MLSRNRSFVSLQLLDCRQESSALNRSSLDHLPAQQISAVWEIEWTEAALSDMAGVDEGIALRVGD
ncbi:MAG: hypothetical protein SGI92_20510 [Bryobacteraceae bacterium]|nr:hypothetical protein [Bryobacteraceae bacterium]